MTSPTLLSLADRCEKLTGRCRETDCLIFEMQHRLLTPERRGTIDGEPTGEYFDLDGNHLPERAPRFTDSLDDAITLLPEGFVWTASKLGNGKFWASIAHPDGDGGYPVEKPTATPAGALTSACLRARSALEASRG